MGNRQTSYASHPAICGEGRKATEDGTKKMTTADKIEAIDHPLKAPDLACLLNFPLQRIYKMARDCQIPSFRFGTAVRFDPQAVADWLRKKSDTQKPEGYCA